VERYLESWKESKEAKGSSLTLEALVAQGF
jgi:hypothetical protein